MYILHIYICVYVKRDLKNPVSGQLHLKSGLLGYSTFLGHLPPSFYLQEGSQCYKIMVRLWTDWLLLHPVDGRIQAPSWMVETYKYVYNYIYIHVYIYLYSDIFRILDGWNPITIYNGINMDKPPINCCRISSIHSRFMLRCEVPPRPPGVYSSMPPPSFVGTAAPGPGKVGMNGSALWSHHWKTWRVEHWMMHLCIYIYVYICV